MGASALRDDGRGYTLCLRPVSTVNDDDRFLDCELFGNGLADPLTAARDQSLLTVQLQIHRQSQSMLLLWHRSSAIMSETSTHIKVPVEDRHVCLGPKGSVAHVTRVVRMIKGRWKLPILFRLYADPSVRTSQLRRDMPGITQKMLTQHLRELEGDRLIERIDFGEKALRVEYQLPEMGRQLLPVLRSARSFSISHPA
jgi:DNA-binding HxlR family transcriptional regulator